MKIENQNYEKESKQAQLSQSFQNLIEKRLKQKLQEESKMNICEDQLNEDSPCNITPENLQKKIKEIDNNKVVQH